MHPTSSGEGFSAYVLAILVVFSFFSSMFIEHLTSDIRSRTVFAFVAVVSSQKVPVKGWEGQLLSSDRPAVLEVRPLISTCALLLAK